jgi:hypothetical protein
MKRFLINILILTFLLSGISLYSKSAQDNLIFADKNMKQRINLFKKYYSILDNINSVKKLRDKKNVLIKTGKSIMKKAVAFTKVLKNSKKDEQKLIINTLKKRNLIKKLRLNMRKTITEQRRILKIKGTKKIFTEIRTQISKYIQQLRTGK